MAKNRFGYVYTKFRIFWLTEFSSTAHCFLLPMVYCHGFTTSPSQAVYRPRFQPTSTGHTHTQMFLSLPHPPMWPPDTLSRKSLVSLTPPPNLFLPHLKPLNLMSHDIRLLSLSRARAPALQSVCRLLLPASPLVHRFPSTRATSQLSFSRPFSRSLSLSWSQSHCLTFVALLPPPHERRLLPAAS